jgi:hypothetical protein
MLPFGITTESFPGFNSFIGTVISLEIVTTDLQTIKPCDNPISNDFGNLLISQNIANVRCANRVTLPPHSELGLWGILAYTLKLYVFLLAQTI